MFNRGHVQLYHKTGPVSQRVTERPGEFADWYNSGTTENIGLGLYQVRERNQFRTAKVQVAVAPAINRTMQEGPLLLRRALDA